MPRDALLDLADRCPLAASLAGRLRAAREALAARWLARISARVSLDPNRVFPTDDLLDHVPLLIAGIADYMEDPARAVAAETSVVAKAMELGALRFAQGFDAYELLKEYEILGGILFGFVTQAVRDIRAPCSRSELMVCAHRLFHAVALIQQATTTHYLTLLKERLGEREERLRAFNRALTHEMRNRIGAALGAGQMLQLPDLLPLERERLAGVVARNAEGMRVLLDNLLELTRVDLEARQQRHVRLPEAAAEAARQLREAARSKGVEVHLSPELPEVEVNAAAVELCLTNLLSNAIKYADPAKPARWVEVSGCVAVDERGGCEVVVTVTDDGLGVPEAMRPRLFARFFRAHGTVTGLEGTGLGLSIVRETVERLGGRAWAEFPPGETRFAFALPIRRAADVAAVSSTSEPLGADGAGRRSDPHGNGAA